MTSVYRYLPQHADRLMKLAQPVVQPSQPGRGEKYLPWYAAAGLGMVGHELGKLVPGGPAAQMAGRIGGTLIGTGLGVHGGEALGKLLDRRRQEKLKEAADESEKKKKSRIKEVGKVVGKGLAGMTLGTLAGAGTGYGLGYAAKRLGVPIPRSAVARYAAPVAGAGLGTAYSLWKAREAKELRDALEGT